MYDARDDIVALATLPGRSALNVVRVSGSGCVGIFKLITNKKIRPRANFALPCSVYNAQNKKTIDFAIITYFQSPKSYTGEDVLEISIHGGSVIADQIITTILDIGARLASPGEFSYRAYINGKIDLLQAEAISALSTTTSVVDNEFQVNSMKGFLSKEIINSKNLLINIITQAEHELDFLDSEINKTSMEQYIENIKKTRKIIANIIKSSIVHEKDLGNIKLSIIGKPNVGKSTLFNMIVGKQKAITSTIKGTTRDALEANILIGQTCATIVDTAGIRKTSNSIEKEGIKKAIKEVECSQVVIIVDQKNPKSIYNNYLDILKNKHVVFVQNKIDKYPKNTDKKIFNISCKTGDGVSKLLTELSTLCNKEIEDIYKQYCYSINLRQKNLLIKIKNRLESCVLVFKETKDFSIGISSLYGVVALYNELVSPDPKNEIINSIFAGFCVGK